MGPTDAELWEAIVSGDNDAWSELVKRYQALVYAVATRLGLSQADAADCFQQTWVLLYKHRRKLLDPSRISAWLVTTARREALRLRKRTAEIPPEYSSNEPADPAPLPSDDLLALERQAQIEIAIAQLDERCRKLVQMFFFSPEETGYEEIAASLGIALNSLGPIRRRCLQRLRSILEENGFLEVRKGGKGSL